MKPQEIIIKSNGHSEEKAFVNQFRIMEFSTTSRDTAYKRYHIQDSNNARFWLKISHIFAMLSNKRCKKAVLLSYVNTKEEKFTLQLCTVIKSIQS